MGKFPAFVFLFSDPVFVIKGNGVLGFYVLPSNTCFKPVAGDAAFGGRPGGRFQGRWQKDDTEGEHEDSTDEQNGGNDGMMYLGLGHGFSSLWYFCILHRSPAAISRRRRRLSGEQATNVFIEAFPSLIPQGWQERSTPEQGRAIKLGRRP